MATADLTAPQPPAEHSVEVDLEFMDSTYGTDNQSELTSLSSSITAYHYENGRRYHSYHTGKYMTPNDEEEMNREDMKHHWCKLILHGKLHLAALQDPKHILDLGTGIGSWCVEMGDTYQSAHIIGTDLSKIQPSLVPPNVQFEIDDWDDDWTYSHQFDFIHSRFNSTAVTSWPNLCMKSFVALKPGGWIEFADLTNPPQSDDDTVPPNSRLVEFFRLLQDGCSKAGRDLQAPRKWHSQLREAGFTSIHERLFKVPIGGWPKDRRLKEAGVFEMETLRDGLPAIGLGFFTRVLGWKPEGVEHFFTGVRAELDNRHVHFYLPLYVTWAQKP